MKQAFERDGKLFENTVGFFDGGLTSEGEEIAREMERKGEAGHIEHNLWWVEDDFDFENQEESTSC